MYILWYQCQQHGAIKLQPGQLLLQMRQLLRYEYTKSFGQYHDFSSLKILNEKLTCSDDVQDSAMCMLLAIECFLRVGILPYISFQFLSMFHNMFKFIHLNIFSISLLNTTCVQLI